MARVLIVDDSSFVRKRVAQALEQAGHVVVGQAREGGEGFDLYRKLRPDVVIMDVTMQGLDGLSGARLIHNYDARARIIFMSLLQDEEVASEAVALGAESFLGKNEYDRLMALIGN